MRLDRYTGRPPKFHVFRRVDSTNDLPEGERVYEFDGAIYRRMPPFDYFVLALKDRFTPDALAAYSEAAHDAGDKELAGDIERLEDEAIARPDRKNPD